MRIPELARVAVALSFLGWGIAQGGDAPAAKADARDAVPAASRACATASAVVLKALDGSDAKAWRRAHDAYVSALDALARAAEARAVARGRGDEFGLTDEGKGMTVLESETLDALASAAADAAARRVRCAYFGAYADGGKPTDAVLAHALANLRGSPPYRAAITFPATTK